MFPYTTYYHEYEPTPNNLRKGCKSPHLSGGGMKQWYITDIRTRFQIFLEPITMQNKSISFKTKQFSPSQEEEHIVPQRLEICATILLT